MQSNSGLSAACRSFHQKPSIFVVADCPILLTLDGVHDGPHLVGSALPQDFLENLVINGKVVVKHVD